MNIKGILIIVGFALIIAVTAFFVFLGNTSRNAPVPGQNNDQGGDSSTVIRDESDQEIAVARTFLDGTHTFVGEINLPTPCHELSHDVIIRESFPEQVTIAFMTSTESDMCAQVVTPEPFTVSFDASRDAQVDMTLENEPLPYYVIEGGDLDIENTSTTSVGTTSAATSSVDS